MRPIEFLAVTTPLLLGLFGVAIGVFELRRIRRRKAQAKAMR